MSRPATLVPRPGPTVAAAVAVALTALALAPTIDGGPWLTQALGLVAVVAATGAALRALHWTAAPRWPVVVVQAVAVVGVLTLAFASDAAVWGVVPGPEAWGTFADLAHQGWAVIERQAAPVTLTEGVRFLVVAGVAAVAWAVDALAVTARRATLAGAPLLLLYLVPATVLPDGVPWPLFLAAGIGWLLLLLADGRQQLARWGRPMQGGAGQQRSPDGSQGGTGRRLGAAALAIAVVVPVILPSLDEGRFGGSPDSAGGGGGGDGPVAAGTRRVITINPIVDLKRDLTRGSDVEVLRYRSDADAPAYLRIATLDAFDGNSWTLEEMQAPPDQQAVVGLPAPSGLDLSAVETTTTTYTVAVDHLDTPRLPLPYPVTSVTIDGDWRWDADTHDVFSAEEGGTALGQRYTATALLVTPTADQLRAAGPPDAALERWTVLPDPVREQLSALALEVTSGAQTDYDQAMALQSWFRSEFQYSLATAPGNDADALASFLRDRSGYCEQFAATMALMARTLGIPSRVEVGFAPGTATRQGSWVVTTHDAHAWPELWFSGVGWVRFEPTPGGGDGAGVPDYASTPSTSVGQPNAGRGGEGVVIRRGGGPIDARPDARRLPDAAGRGGLTTSTGDTGAAAPGDRPFSSWWLVAVLLLVASAVAAAPAAARTVARQRRRSMVVDRPSAVVAAWADVLDTATDVDLAPTPTDTPRDLARQLRSRGGLAPEDAQAVQQLATWVEQVRYGAPGGSPLPPSPEVAALATEIERGLLGALSPRDRRRARLWPHSGQRTLAQWWASLGAALLRARARVGRRAGRAVRGRFSGRRRADAPSALRSGS